MIRGRQPVLIDSGPASTKAGLARRLREAGIEPNQLGAVLLTHSHADHAGGAKQFADAGVPVVLGAADSVLAARGKNDELIPTGPAGRILRRLISSTFPAFAASIPVANAHYFSDDWRRDLEVVLGLIEAHRPEHILVGVGGPLHSDAAKRRIETLLARR